MNFSKYRVKPGSKVTLKDWDAGDKSAVPADKAMRVKQLEDISEEINDLQNVLYASQEEGVLIVLQGMDTSGKVGTIRHVFKAVDPLGVRCRQSVMDKYSWAAALDHFGDAIDVDEFVDELVALFPFPGLIAVAR